MINYEVFLKIIDHFTEESQVEKLKQEQKELLDAIDEHNTEHIAEELADNLNMLIQFAFRYGIRFAYVGELADAKIDRINEYFNTGSYKDKKIKLEGDIYE